MPIPAPPLPPGVTFAPGSGAMVLRTSRIMSKRRFMGRLTVDEYNAITAFRLNPATPFAIRVQLETLKELRDMSDDIRLDDPDTVIGVASVVGLLSTLEEGTPGRVAPNDVPARIAAWRADFPTEAEAIAIANELGVPVP